jgi:hypothetical protein
MISAESLAGICTLWMWSMRTLMPDALVKRLASSASFTSEAGA